MADDGLEAAIERIYSAPAAEFTSRRAELVREARASGDRDLAARIGALAKPTAAADLANRTARDAPEDLDELGELGDALRRAQREGDRKRLTELGARRRAVLTGIVERAADRAARDGKRPGASVLEELQQTLQAALVSEEASRALRSGRLVRALAADGFEPEGLARAVAGPARRPTVGVDDAADGAAQAEAARRAELETAAARARQTVDIAAEQRDRALAAVEQQEATVQELEERLRDARGRLDGARSDLAVAERAAEKAATAADEAERAATDPARIRTNSATRRPEGAPRRPPADPS